MKLSKISKSTFEFMGAKFTIKNLLSGDILSIQDASNSATTELKEIDGEYLPSRTVKSSKKTESFLIIHKSVVAWENVFDGDGKKLDCDDGGKKRFCEEIDLDVFSEFFKLLTEERDKLFTVSKKQREKAVKN